MSVLAIYEPRRLKEPDFLAGFVARTELVDFLLVQLRLCADGDGRHRLILGQRGMGKTSLLRRLQIAIRDDAELNAKLVPLTFREEQYNVRSLDRLWRNCGDSLAEWLEATGDTAAAEALDRAMEDKVWEAPDSAAEAFADRMRVLGRRPVLLIDNLDLILNALPDQQRWQLRRILQAPDGPILFGAATTAPEQLGDPDSAFYEFFRWDMLEPLTASEMMSCMRRLADANPATSKPVLEVLQRSPARLRVLHNLTGGNPRILTLLYQLLERADSDSVYSDLEGLLDQLTPLYKARVEDLRSDMQRAILDAIALHWDPMTVRTLGQVTGIAVTGLPSQLARLQEFGLIEEVPTSGARAGYQIAERFFNVWYLMRHGTRRTKYRMRWLTGFLETFYSYEELIQLRVRIVEGAEPNEWTGLVITVINAALERRVDIDPLVSSILDDSDNPERVTLCALESSARDIIENILADGVQPDAKAAVDTLRRNLDDPANAGRSAAYLVAKILQSDQFKFEMSLKIFDAIRRSVRNSTFVCYETGNIYLDFLKQYSKAEKAFSDGTSEAGDYEGLCSIGLTSVYAMSGRLDAALGCRRQLEISNNLMAKGIDALIEIASDNFGQAVNIIGGMMDDVTIHVMDMASVLLLRFLRFSQQRGYGEKLISWLSETGRADRQAPLYAALVAFVRGESALLDFNPEVRPAASDILSQLLGRRIRIEDLAKTNILPVRHARRRKSSAGS